MSKTVKEVIANAPRFHPTLSLERADLKGIKNWKVGETHTLTVRVKVVGLSEDDDFEPGLRARCRITRVEEER